MEDWTKRFALAALFGFIAFVFALPVSCMGFVVYNEHLYGDVQHGGPAAVLRGGGTGLLIALLVAIFVWRRTRPR